MKITVIFDNLGPYHVARLTKLAEYCELSVIELHGKSAEYAWKSAGAVDFECATLLGANGQSDGRIRPLLEAALTKLAPDVVFVPGWDSLGAIVGLAWCSLHKIPAIVLSDSQEIDVRRNVFKEQIKRHILKHAAGMFVAGSRHKAYAIKLGMPVDRIDVGYDVVDNAHFRLGAAEACKDEACRPIPGPYFLGSARFIERKNIDGLLDGYAKYHALAEVHHLTPHRLVILGDGDLRSQIEAKIDRLRLWHAIHLAGFQQYQQLSRYYAFATAFVHIPLSEQWGLVVNEALASGLPVIVSDVCGCAPELVEDGVNGFTLKASDTDKLADLMLQMTEMAESDRQKLGARSLEMIDGFSLEVFAQTAMRLAQLAVGAPRLQGPNVVDRWVLSAFCTIRCRR